MKTITPTIIAAASFITSLVAADETKVINTPYGVITVTSDFDAITERAVQENARIFQANKKAEKAASQRAAQIIASRKVSDQAQFAANAAILIESAKAERVEATRIEAARIVDAQAQADTKAHAYQKRQNFYDSDAFKIMILEKRVKQMRSNKLQRR